MSKDLANREENTSITLMPVLDPEQAAAAYNAYLKLCESILIPYDKRIVKNGVVIQESDYQRITQRKKVDGKWIAEQVDFPKKSAWRKLSKFYGVSTEILEKNREDHEDGSFTWNYSVRAWQGPVSTTGEASCTNTEKGTKSRHDTKATAHTRAKSRAISDLIGFGQVSAEEIGNDQPAFNPPATQEGIRREVEAEFEEKNQPVWDGDLSIPNIQSYLTANGFEGEKFKIRHDEPSRMYIVDSAPWTDEFDLLLTIVKEMGGEYDKDHKKTVFRY